MLILKRLSEDCRRPLVLTFQLLLSLRVQFRPLHTRICVWTPWSVFQDGSFDTAQIWHLESDVPSDGSPPRGSRNIRGTRFGMQPGRQDLRSHLGCPQCGTTAKPPRERGGSTDSYALHRRVPALLLRPVTLGIPATQTAGEVAADRLRKTESTSRTAPRFQTLALHRFQARLTLFPKCFSPFPHGTCTLSYSGRYLAADGTYHRICAPVPRNTTLWTVNRTQVYMPATKGSITLRAASFQRLPLENLLIEDLHTTGPGSPGF